MERRVEKEEEKEKEKEKEKGESSSSSSSYNYRYWVRNISEEDAAPLPLPHKLEQSSSLLLQSHLGSAWNRAGTWEEKSLNNWATPRIKELLISIGSIHFSSGTAQVEDVTKCVGDAFMVIVRNKKRVSYTYELTLKVKGEWVIRGDKKSVRGHIDVAEFSFGELDDLQMEVSLSEAKDILHQDKIEIHKDLKLFFSLFGKSCFSLNRKSQIDREWYFLFLCWITSTITSGNKFSVTV